MSEDGILFTYLYETLILQRQRESVPARFPDDWAQHAIDVIDSKLIPGWNVLLDTEETFLEKMATPARLGYQAYLTPGLVTRTGLSTALATVKHGVRLAASYARLKASIDLMLGTFRDDFEQRLRDSRPAYRAGEALPLALTGDYVEGVLGAAVRQCFFLDGNPTLTQYRWSSDLQRGTLPPDQPFADRLPRQFFAMQLVRLLIQGGCLLLQGLDLTTVHAALDRLLKSALSVWYEVPPTSTIRLFFSSGLPYMRTTLALLEAPRAPMHQEPQCPSFTYEFTIVVPGDASGAVYNYVVVDDIPHVATFDDFAEFQVFTYGGTHFPDLAEVALENPDTHILEDTHGTSSTAILVGPFQDVSLVTQAGLNYGRGEGPWFVSHEMTIQDHDVLERRMHGRVLSYTGENLQVQVLAASSGTGTGANWDIYRRSNPQQLRAFGTILRGETLYGEYFYTITDNFGSVGTGYFTIRITAV